MTVTAARVKRDFNLPELQQNLTNTGSTTRSLVFEVVFDHSFIDDVLHELHVEGGEGGLVDARVSSLSGLGDLGHVGLWVRTLLQRKGREDVQASDAQGRKDIQRQFPLICSSIINEITPIHPHPPTTTTNKQGIQLLLS